MEINVPEIQRVMAHIEGDKRRLEMRYWGMKKDLYSLHRYHDWAPCNTACCFAGWTVLLNTPQEQWENLFDEGGQMYDVQDKAAALLGLTDDYAYRIFMGEAIHCDNREEQLRLLKEDINSVLEDAGVPERV